MKALRTACVDDAAIVELKHHVALNLFTNDVNLAFAVPVDFLPVPLRRSSRTGAGEA